MIMAVVGAVRSRTVDPHHRQGKFDFESSTGQTLCRQPRMRPNSANRCDCRGAGPPTSVSPFMKLNDQLR